MDDLDDLALSLPQPARRAIEALKLAIPAAIAAHFDDGLNHCVVSCLAGIDVLQRRGFTARMVARGMVCVDDTKNTVISVGMSAREVYDHSSFEGRPRPSFEEWEPKEAVVVRPGLELIHTVILARYHDTPLFLDLTMGQLRAHGVPVPLTLSIPGAEDGLCRELAGKDWTVRYFELERDLKRWEEADVSGFAADLDELTSLALDCDLRPSLFFRAVHRANPRLFDRLWERLVRFGLFATDCNPAKAAEETYLAVTS
jgi:hypothetical protein